MKKVGNFDYLLVSQFTPVPSDVNETFSQYSEFTKINQLRNQISRSDISQIIDLRNKSLHSRIQKVYGLNEAHSSSQIEKVSHLDK